MSKTCFVVMGFGKKTDFETGRVLDLNKSYKNIIKPAVEAAGLECVRADEIVHSGLIDVPMYDQLLNADLVVADLSTSNKNALYELGVRHALRPFTTIIIAEDGISQLPFDINRILTRRYHHMGDDIGYDEVMRFREELTAAIKEIMAKNPRSHDSPVYSTIGGLVPPLIKKEIKAIVEEVKNEPGTSHSAMMQEVDEAQRANRWLDAKEKLLKIHEMMTGDSGTQQQDPYVVQRLALITYKSKDPSEKEALLEAQAILQKLGPATSNDTETLGLWGAIHKRIAELDKENAASMNEAVRAYERGFYLRNDYYNGINYAYLLNVRASRSQDHAEAIADFIEARRTRKEVIEICNQWLKANPFPDEKKSNPDYLKNWYWVQASLGEAYFGSGEPDKGIIILEEAYAKAPEEWMKQSTKDQIAKLTPMLQDSPLKYVVS